MSKVISRVYSQACRRIVPSSLIDCRQLKTRDSSRLVNHFVRYVNSTSGLASPLVFSSAVRDALNNGSPIVCLESTIITHGMAYPSNMKMAREVERVIERYGATPATIAIIDGKPHIGLEDANLVSLAKTGTSARKISRRDLASVVADGETGGTTVSATMILAKRAGIKVFVTGGIGGVHRHGQETMDISNDLCELSKNDVTVVCAGPKAILDIPRTLEYLETMGVTVTTMGQANLPAFYSRDSKIKSPQVSADPLHVARMIEANHSLGLGSSILVCVPIPFEASMNSEEMDNIIQKAILESETMGITGKDSTPYLLAAVSKATQGKSLAANIALVMENAKVGAQIACELSTLKSQDTLREIPRASLVENTISESSVVADALADLEEGFSINAYELDRSFPAGKQLPEVLVFGGVAVDVTCTIETPDASSVLKTSNPGRTTRTMGGVGGNIARAAALNGSRVELASLVGARASSSESDPEGQDIQKSMQDAAIETQFLAVADRRTASYTCIQANGSLVTAVADMDLFSDQDSARDLISRLVSQHSGLKGDTGTLYKAIILDGNLMHAIGPTGLRQLSELSADIVCFEPTSAAKSTTIFRKDESPFNIFTMTTPNTIELTSMYTAARNVDVFETSEWWDAINAFNVNQDFRNKADHFLRHHKILEALNLVETGAIQQALHLLPIMQNIYLTLGQAGVLSFHTQSIGLTRTGGWKKQSMTHEGVKCNVTLVYHPAEALPEGSIVVSDTGCGDTFTGVLVSCLVQGTSMVDAVRRAQRAAVLTLTSAESVSPLIKSLSSR